MRTFKNYLTISTLSVVLLSGCKTDEPCIDDSQTANAPSAANKSNHSEKELQDSIYNPSPVGARRIWADSWLYAKAPELEVDTWLSDKPDTKGKYVLIEFWGTYCPPCRKTIPILNKWHEKYKDELIIIGISHEPVETVKNFKEHKLEYYSAVDPEGRTKSKMNVFGVPHIIILEPENGCIIWEGFPLLKGYELTEKTIEKILAVGRKSAK